jgi:hypothetical protein
LLAVVVVTFRPQRDGSGAPTQVPGDDAGDKFGITVQPTPVASGEAFRIFFSVPETEVRAIKRWLSDDRGAAMFSTTHDGKEVNHGGILARNAHVVRHVEVRQGDVVLYEQTIPVPAAGGVVPGSFSLTSDSFESRPTASLGKLQVSFAFNRHYEYSALKMMHCLCGSTVLVPVE